VAGYIVFALAAALAAFMLGVWLFQRFKARGSRGGRRY
jgi:flagellar biogenesis protein FliO